MREKYIKSEIKVINFEASDIIATSDGMVQGTVGGSATFKQASGLVGGNVSGATIFDE